MNFLIGGYRYFYNRAIQYINNYNKLTKQTYYLIDYKNENSKIILDLSNVKYKFSMETMLKLINNNYPEWLNNKNFIAHLVNKAFTEACNNYKTCLIKFKKYKIPFKLKVKTKKSKYQTINIEKVMIGKKHKYIFPNYKYKDEYIFRTIKYDKYLIDINNICDSSISFNSKLNEYYLNINYYDKKLKNNLLLNNKKVCAIDPGLRTFLTVYSDNTVDEIGNGISEKLKKLCNEVDIITSRIYKKENKKFKYNKNSRRNMKKALHRKIKYKSNIIKELHNKSIKYLTDRYAKIIITPFEIQEMACKFNSKIARNLYNVSYFAFKTKLKNKCDELGIEYVCRPEYYTSKTCTICGCINYNLGSNKVFNCNKCNLTIQRDYNGARNIMLRNNF